MKNVVEGTCAKYQIIANPPFRLSTFLVCTSLSSQDTVDEPGMNFFFFSPVVQCPDFVLLFPAEVCMPLDVNAVFSPPPPLPVTSFLFTAGGSERAKGVQGGDGLRGADGQGRRRPVALEGLPPRLRPPGTVAGKQQRGLWWGEGLWVVGCGLWVMQPRHVTRCQCVLRVVGADFPFLSVFKRPAPPPPNRSYRHTRLSRSSSG